MAEEERVVIRAPTRHVISASIASGIEIKGISLTRPAYYVTTRDAKDVGSTDTTRAVVRWGTIIMTVPKA